MSGQELLSRFRRTTRAFKQSHFFMFYIMYCAVGVFAAACFRHHEKCPRPRYPGQTRCAVRASTTRRPVPHIDDSEGSVVPRSVTDSTEQWVWCFYAHVVYVICYFCYIFSSGSSSGSSGSVRIYRRVIFGKQNW